MRLPTSNFDRKLCFILRGMMRPSTVLLRAVAALPPRVKQKILKVEPILAAKNLPSLPGSNEGKRNLLIGPANSAGQAKLWAQAAATTPGWSASNLTYVSEGMFNFASDYSVPEKSVVYSPKWAKALRTNLVENYAAVLDESLLPLFGSLSFQDATRELTYLRKHGLRIGVICHGSDIRVPSQQIAQINNSVFLEAPPDTVAALEAQSIRNNALLDRLNVPTFVSTPDLLKYRPDATWLPLQVPVAFRGGSVVESVPAAEAPVVLHLPSKSYTKGTPAIKAQMQKLHDQGIINFVTPGTVPHSEMRNLMVGADIIIDAIGMGAYGVTSVEALALGKTVVAEVGHFTRLKVKELTGQTVPIQEATIATLTDVVTGLARDTGFRRKLAEEGRDYVASVHSVDAAREALSDFLD